MKTVTIGISAHNEEKNILHLLESIRHQKMNGFVLEKIIVMLDGCTDDTLNIVHGFSKQLKHTDVYNDRRRLGKSQRVNQIFDIAKSDILVLLDADTILGSSYTLKEIVSSFSDPTVGLVGGYDQPVKAKTFFEKIVSYSDFMWYQIRKDIDNSQTIHNHHSCISALSKKFYKEIKLPKNAIADDDFVYISNHRLGYAFRFAKRATLKYKCPSTLEEYLSQSVRFLKLKDEIAKYFGESSKAYYAVPTRHKIKAMMYCFLRNPLLFTLAMGLQVLSRLAVRADKGKKNNGYWKTIRSSKEISTQELFIKL
jgi:glycosyltransferase involved in cell wall biosynthesis